MLTMEDDYESDYDDNGISVNKSAHYGSDDGRSDDNGVPYTGQQEGGQKDDENDQKTTEVKSCEEKETHQVSTETKKLEALSFSAAPAELNTESDVRMEDDVLYDAGHSVEEDSKKIDEATKGGGESGSELVTKIRIPSGFDKADGKAVECKRPESGADWPQEKLNSSDKDNRHIRPESEKDGTIEEEKEIETQPRSSTAEENTVDEKIETDERKAEQEDVFKVEEKKGEKVDWQKEEKSKGNASSTAAVEEDVGRESISGKSLTELKSPTPGRNFNDAESSLAKSSSSSSYGGIQRTAISSAEPFHIQTKDDSLERKEASSEGLRGVQLKQSYFTLIFAFTILGSFPGVSSKLTIFPSDAIVKSGAAVRLKCSTDQQKAIYWDRKLFNSAKQETIYYGHNGMAIVEGGRFTVDKKPEIGQYDLVIENVQPEDAGTYICLDEAGFGIPSRAELVIASNISCDMRMPKNGFMGENMFQISGDSIHANCTLVYRGNRVPHLRWFWNSVPVEQDDVRSNNDDKMALTVVSQVTERAEMRMNGERLSCRVQLADNKQMSTNEPVQWTSETVSVRYAKYETGKVEECPGVVLLPQCNPPCDVQVKKNSLNCQCVSVYKGQEMTYNVTIGEFNCEGAVVVVSWTVLLAVCCCVSVLIVSTVVGVVALICIRRKKTGCLRVKDDRKGNEDFNASGSQLLRDSA